MPVMLFECATVIDVQREMLSVRSIRGSACERCERGEGCGGGIIGKLAFRTQPTLSLSVSNARSFSIGESVELSVDPHRLMLLAACVYLLPLLALLAGAVAGQALLGTDKGAIMVSVLALLVMLLVLRAKLANSLARWLRPSVQRAVRSGLATESS